MSEKQHWDPERYNTNAGFVSELGLPVLELLAPQAGEHILDLGCGEGALAARLTDAGCTVVAVDASAEQVEAARARGLDARVVDGAKLAFAAEFDAVFSNAALHWMPDPAAVIAGVHRSLKPGGRFVAEFGGHGNVACIREALVAGLERRGHDGKAADPWYFPDTHAYGALLEAGRFRVESIDLIPRPTPLPGDVLGWLRTFGESFTNVLPESDRQPYLQEVQEAARDTLQADDGSWTADYVRLRFSATRV